MSNYEVRFSNRAKKDALKLEQSNLDDKAKELVKIIKSNPYQNPPPFEKLAGGDYSRRINIQHRLVYYVLREERIIVVTSMWTDYE